VRKIGIIVVVVFFSYLGCLQHDCVSFGCFANQVYQRALLKFNRLWKWHLWGDGALVNQAFPKWFCSCDCICVCASIHTSVCMSMLKHWTINPLYMWDG